MEETAKEKTRLLSPKIDSVFQVLFGEVGSEFITKELLEAILGEEISDVDLSNNPILRKFNPEDKMKSRKENFPKVFICLFTF